MARGKEAGPARLAVTVARKRDSRVFARMSHLRMCQFICASPIRILEMAFFHATSARCGPGIAARGLRTGREVGAQPHPGFADSLDHLHVSNDLEVAQWWARILGDRSEAYLIYCVDDRYTEIEVSPDPLSKGGVDFGFIVEGGYIPAEFLSVVDTVPIQTGIQDAQKSLSVLREAGWVIPDPVLEGPPGRIVWSVGGYKGPHTLNRAYGETRREAAWKALEQVRQCGFG